MVSRNCLRSPDSTMIQDQAIAQQISSPMLVED
jgi:hypothetical protein